MYCLVPTIEVSTAVAPGPAPYRFGPGAFVTEQIKALLTDDLSQYTVMGLSARSDGLVPVMTAAEWVDPRTPAERYLGL